MFSGTEQRLKLNITTAWISVVESIVGHSSPAMTRHYTHTGEAAAIAAVTALPSLIGEETKALQAAAPRLIDPNLLF